MKIVNFSKTVLSVLIIGLTSCSTNNTIQSTEETIKKSGFVAPSKFETSVLFPNYMVEDYKSRNMSTKSFSIKRMKQVDAVRIVIKSEQDGISQEKIVYPSSENVTATFDNVSIGRVKVYAEAWGTGGYQPSNKSNVITSGEAFVSVSENKLSEAYIALEIPKAQVDAIIEKKYGKGSVKAIVTLVEKSDTATSSTVSNEKEESNDKPNEDGNLYSLPNFNDQGYYSPINPFDQFGKNWYECTRYAYGRAYEKTGKKLTFSISSERHGGKWFDIINDLPRGSEPRANSIISWKKGTYGHVAFVEKVEGNNITISESNWASPTDGKYKGLNTFTKESIKNRTGYVLSGYVYLD